MPAESPTRADPSSEPWVVVARVVRSRGNRGEVLADIETDFPEERLLPGGVTLRDPSGRLHEMRLDEVWFHKGRVVLRFAKMDGISAAEKLRGWEWVVREEDLRPLPEGSFYRHRIEGLRAVDREGGRLGEIERIEEQPGGDLLVVRSLEGREILVPLARIYVLAVREPEGEVILDLPRDLVDLNG